MSTNRAGANDAAQIVMILTVAIEKLRPYQEMRESRVGRQASLAVTSIEDASYRVADIVVEFEGGPASEQTINEAEDAVFGTQRPAGDEAVQGQDDPVDADRA